MPILYVAGVSISENPKDISNKTLSIINECQIVVGEERKSALRLLSVAGSTDKELYLINEHSCREDRQEALAAILKSEKSVLFSDAGTPCISDPDWSLIDMCRKNGVEIRSLPGPSSLTTALSVSGMDAKTFFFAGFPPKEKDKRKIFFDEINKSKNVTVFMERPYALEQTLNDMINITRKISLSVELGCGNEKNYFETPKKLLEILKKIKAPFVIVAPPA